MSKGKIAPDLQDVLACGDEVWCDLFGDRGVAVRRQVLALLSVARAAERLTHYLGSDLPGNQDCLSKPEAEVMRALTRLRKASGTGRGKT